MSTTKKVQDATPFEIKILEAHEEWFDPVGIRFFINTTDKNVTLGFSHNIRTVEMIAILDAAKEKNKRPRLETLEGEEIEE
jgi:hypothetical protein